MRKYKREGRINKNLMPTAHLSGYYTDVPTQNTQAHVPIYKLTMLCAKGPCCVMATCPRASFVALSSSLAVPTGGTYGDFCGDAKLAGLAGGVEPS